MKRLLRWMLLGLVLVVVAMVSALTAMRLAIHGREAEVPKLAGLEPAQARQALEPLGLLLEVESRFFNADQPPGRIVSQLPQPGTRVRRGWRVRVAVSLGAQRAIVPSVLGQSPRAAEINIRRRGLELGSTSVVHIPDLPGDQVVGQSPSPQATEVAEPRIHLLVNAPASEQGFIMPDFIGRPLADAAAELEAAGLKLGKVTSAATLPVSSDPENTEAISISTPTVVRRQSPAPGSKVLPGAQVNFEITRQAQPSPLAPLE